MNCPSTAPPCRCPTGKASRSTTAPTVGVWLDRGELDKIIERSAGWTPERDDGARDERQPETPKKKSKSKSFFETIMESVGEG